MIIFLIIGVILGVIAVFFTLQNVAIITVSLFSWDFTGSLALILGLAIFSGALIVALFVLPESIQSYFQFRKLRKDYKKLEEELRKQKELTTFAKTTPPTPDNIASIENGAVMEHTVNKIS